MSVAVTGVSYQSPWFGLTAADKAGAEPQAADQAGMSTDAAVNNTGWTAGPVKKAGSLVSNALGKALLSVQEKGSAFNQEEEAVLDRRGVSAADRQRYGEIIQDAVDRDAFKDPQAYIRSLSTDDIEVLRKVQGLAETKGVTGVSTDEGAINLLLPNHMQLDLNNDGLVTSGVGQSFHFPPPNAPQAVKEAWAETSKDMSFRDKMMVTASFMVETWAANAKHGADGKITGFNQPGDADFKNPYGETVADWQAMTGKLADYYKWKIAREGQGEAEADRGILGALQAFKGNMA